jgi:hemolysin activation/secretion protein
LNRNRLLEALQLLQLNPLIKNISANLAAGTRPNTSVEVQVTEAKTFSTQLILDNNRPTSVGSFERGIQLNHANLLGIGDGLSVGYTNSDGTNNLNTGYSLPFNPETAP